MDFGLLSLPVLALSALFGYAVFFDVNAVIFNKVNVPASLEYQGYKGDVVAARLANEIRVINKKARTVKELRRFELPDDESAINELGEYFEFLAPIRATQQLMGLIEYNFTGDIVKYNDVYRMQLRGSNMRDNRHFTSVEDGDNMEELIHTMAINASRFIDPYVVASYYYQTTVDSLTTDSGPVDFSKTEDEVRNCLRIMPETELHWPYNLRGVALLREGKPDQALEQFGYALHIQPNFILGNYNAGTAWLAKGDYDKAIALFKKTLRLDAENNSLHRTPHAYSKWGVALARQGKTDEAIAMFKKAEQISPTFDIVHYDWGKVLLQEGKTAEAKRHFLRAARLAPERKLYQAAAAAIPG